MVFTGGACVVVRLFRCGFEFGLVVFVGLVCCFGFVGLGFAFTVLSLIWVCWVFVDWFE